MNLGARLLKARQHANLTQKQLEKASGVSQKTISKIERGDQAVSSQIVPLALACGVRAEWLASKSGEMLHGALGVQAPPASSYDALTDEAKDIALLWQHLPEDRRAMFKELIFMEAALHRHMPWLRAGRPKNGTYNQFERRVQSAIDKLCAVRVK